MAEDILVTEHLSSDMIKAGARLVERLDDKEAKVKSAFWFYSPEDKTWRLIIASPLVDDIGPREYYRKVLDANTAASNDEALISLNDISVTNTTNQFVQILSHAGARLANTRLSRSAVAGNFIEDSYIYRANL